ncbi:hypothetical protein J1N35_003553 [Gossypium stocksii]|uniref:Uncharacterized protein n=1 Tax=Gossypium stocksii TaxID=47602 RepID=A0A9D4AH65_9ROSI|nr:hypothetical protein J1N35_003553 [Gossypium stocksii]
MLEVVDIISLTETTRILPQNVSANTIENQSQIQVVDLGTQIKYFKKVGTSLRQELGVAKAKNLLSKAVYLIGIRGNNYLTKKLNYGLE